MGGFLQNTNTVVIDPSIATISETEAINSVYNTIQDLILVVDLLQTIVNTMNA